MMNNKSRLFLCLSALTFFSAKASKLGISIYSFAGGNHSGLKLGSKVHDLIQEKNTSQTQNSVDDNKEGVYKNYGFIFGAQADCVFVQNNWFFGAELGAIMNCARYGVDSTYTRSLSKELECASKKYEQKKAAVEKKENFDEKFAPVFAKEKEVRKLKIERFREDITNLSPVEKLTYETDYEKVKDDATPEIKTAVKEFSDAKKNLGADKSVLYSLYSKRERLNKKLESLSDEAKNKEYTLDYSVKSDRGPMFFIGPNIGFFATPRLKFAFAIDLIGNNIVIEPKLENLQSFDKTFYGLMYKGMVSYAFTDRISAYGFVGWVNFFQKNYDKKTDDDETVKKDVESQFRPQHENMLMLGVGVSFKLR